MTIYATFVGSHFNADKIVQTVSARGHYEADGRGQPKQDAGAAQQVQGLQGAGHQQVRVVSLIFFSSSEEHKIPNRASVGAKKVQSTQYKYYSLGHCCAGRGGSGGLRGVTQGRGSTPWLSCPPPSTFPPNCCPPRRRSQVGISVLSYRSQLILFDSGMLVQAARMLDNLGDKRMVEQCNKLMANLSSNLAAM